MIRIEVIILSILLLMAAFPFIAVYIAELAGWI